MPDERCIAHENLSFLRSWTPRRGPRSAATHAPMCNWVASHNLSPKLVIFVALKRLIRLCVYFHVIYFYLKIFAFLLFIYIYIYDLLYFIFFLMKIHFLKIHYISVRELMLDFGLENDNNPRPAAVRPRPAAVRPIINSMKYDLVVEIFFVWSTLQTLFKTFFSRFLKLRFGIKKEESLVNTWSLNLPQMTISMRFWLTVFRQTTNICAIYSFIQSDRWVNVRLTDFTRPSLFFEFLLRRWERK